MDRLWNGFDKGLDEIIIAKLKVFFKYLPQSKQLHKLYNSHKETQNDYLDRLNAITIMKDTVLINVRDQLNYTLKYISYEDFPGIRFFIARCIKGIGI